MHQLYVLLCHNHLFTNILGEEYIKSLIANPELMDRLALSSDDKVNACLFFVPNTIGHHSLFFLLPLIFFFSFLAQNEISSSKVLFPEHLPLSRIQAGIKSGSFLQGTFRASRDNYLEATVFIQGEGEESTEVRARLHL